MQQIPVFYENVRRTALIIKPKEPFFDWLTSVDKTTVVKESEQDHDVYLLPDFETIEEMEKWLKTNFDDLFTDQMNNWWTDENSLVQNRNFKMFKEWFDFSMHTMIWDTLEEEIEKI